MGNYVNKFIFRNEENEKEIPQIQSSTEKTVVEKGGMYTPPLSQKNITTDPRSVTTGIKRTPIEVNGTPVGLHKRMITAIPRHLYTKPYLETDIDKLTPSTPRKRFTPKLNEDAPSRFSDLENENIPVTPIMETVKHKKIFTPLEKARYEILGLDPRSPAADFNRTPILTPKSITRLKARSQENLLRRGSYTTDCLPYCFPTFSYCETSSDFNIPEIQVLPDINLTVLKSLNALNIDCEENVNEYSSPLSDSEKTISSENLKLNYNNVNNEMYVKSISIDQELVKSEEKRLEIKPEANATTKQNNCNDCNDCNNCINCNNMRIMEITQSRQTYINDKIKVWRDSLSSEEAVETEFAESDNTEFVADKMASVPKEEVIITFDNDSIVKDTLSLKLAKNGIDCQTKTEVTGKKKKAFKSDVKSLIDEKKIHSDDKNRNESSKVRTPLGNRSNNGGQTQRLSAKSPQQLFRKGVTPRRLQENTPPHKKCSVKSKLNNIQWDPDSTVII